MKIILLTFLLFSLSGYSKNESLLTFKNTRIYEPMKGSIATAGYVDITNNTEKEVKLTISKAAPFKAVETHETIEKDGRMSMRKIDHFSIPAKGALTLKPGGNHIMLFEPSNPVRSGDKINVEFMVNGKIEKVEFVVVPRMQHSTHEKHH